MSCAARADTAFSPATPRRSSGRPAEQWHRAGPQPGLVLVEIDTLPPFFLPFFTRSSYGQRWGKIEGTRQEALIMQNILSAHSYECGVIDCFNETRALGEGTGPQPSHHSAAERDALIPFASCCHQYATGST